MTLNRISEAALILIDLQNDFCEKGSLAVPRSEEIIPLINRLQKQFDLIIATKDFHPKDHISFAANHPHKKIGDIITINNIPQILWPIHCVQNTKGADFHPKLHTDKINKIIYKGTDKNIDSYSAFFDNAASSATELASFLHLQKVNTLYMVGLATDYCVKYSCLDAIKLGFKTYLIQDASCGVEVSKGDIDKAIQEMQNAGVCIVHSDEIG